MAAAYNQAHGKAVTIRPHVGRMGGTICVQWTLRAFRQARCIAARQLHALKQHHTGKLRLFDMKEMFLQRRDRT